MNANADNSNQNNSTSTVPQPLKNPNQNILFFPEEQVAGHFGRNILETVLVAWPWRFS